MPFHTRVLVHDRGPALWPEHKGLAEIQALQLTTPPLVWFGTYQGMPRSPEGSAFRRAWWIGRNRYNPELAPGEGWEPHATDGQLPQVMTRLISLDTAAKDKVENAYTAAVVGELHTDYRLSIRWVERHHYQHHELVEFAQALLRQWDADGKLSKMIIEDKSSGTSLYQTLYAAGDDEVRQTLAPWMPTVDKESRWGQASIWCKNGSVLLPQPHGNLTPWLYDFEDELFSVPNSVYADQADAFSQLVLYLEHWLGEGLRARLASREAA